MIDIIISNVFPLCFKMVDSFEKLHHILRYWAKDKIKNSLVEALNRYEEKGEIKSRFFLRK